MALSFVSRFLDRKVHATKKITTEMVTEEIEQEAPLRTRNDLDPANLSKSFYVNIRIVDVMLLFLSID